MNTNERRILHINIVNFHVAVARALEPRLVSYPVAVASQGRQRRVILDMSSEALEAGVRRNMLLDDALRKCRDLVVINPKTSACERANRVLLQAAGNLSPGVEPAGPGHVFVDLTGTTRLWGKSVDTAEQMRRLMLDKYKLPSTAGLSANKLVSKVATRVIKPAGFCSIVHGCEQDFLGPLPVYLLPGIDEEIIRKILQFNIFTAGELRAIPAGEYEKTIGHAAYEMHRIASGIDDSPVRDCSAAEEIVEESAVVSGQTNDENELFPQLSALVERASARIRKMGVGTQSAELSLVYADDIKSTRTAAFPAPVNGGITLGLKFRQMFLQAYARRVRLSSIDVRLKKLCSPWGQTDLFYNTESEQNLMSAIDAVRGKFGDNCIKFGRK